MPTSIDAVGVSPSTLAQTNQPEPQAASLPASTPNTPPTPTEPDGPTREELQEQWNELESQIAQEKAVREDSMADVTATMMLALTMENAESAEGNAEPVDEFDQSATPSPVNVSQMMRMRASGLSEKMLAVPDRTDTMRAEQIQIESAMNDLDTQSNNSTMVA